VCFSRGSYNQCRIRERFGDVLVAQGNLPEALNTYRDSLAIAERMAEADPNIQ